MDGARTLAIMECPSHLYPKLAGDSHRYITNHKVDIPLVDSGGRYSLMDWRKAPQEEVEFHPYQGASFWINGLSS